METVMPIDERIADDAWTAVLTRDRGWDGRVLYAVTTTGIYCRPSCPSRKPRREHVRLFRAPDEAEAAGFRPCDRCLLRAPDGDATDDRVRRALAFLDAHADERVPLARLAREVDASASRLGRVFRDKIGLSPREYQDARRFGRLRERLGAGDGVERAAGDAGFGSNRGVYERATDNLGMTPGRYRRGGEGLAIRWTIVDSALGRMLVAATADGVCTVALGDDDGALEAEFRREFFRARIDRDDAVLREWAEAVARLVAGDVRGPAVPVDLRGTVFQLRVWKALREIPRGEMRSYAEVAETIGRPGSARAVARACAGNRAAIVVPCHRVVRGDGSPGGYRWGIDRKRRLLDAEGATPDSR